MFLVWSRNAIVGRNLAQVSWQATWFGKNKQNCCSYGLGYANAKGAYK